MIYLMTVEEHKETKTLIKKRVPSPGDKLYGLTLYTVHNMAGVSLGDFSTIAAARAFCHNEDKVLVVEMGITMRRMVNIYWNNNRSLKTDEFMHSVERDLERIGH